MISDEFLIQQQMKIKQQEEKIQEISQQLEQLQADSRQLNAPAPGSRHSPKSNSRVLFSKNSSLDNISVKKEAEPEAFNAGPSDGENMRAGGTTSYNYKPSIQSINLNFEIYESQKAGSTEPKASAQLKSPTSDEHKLSSPQKNLRESLRYSPEFQRPEAEIVQQSLRLKLESLCEAAGEAGADSSSQDNLVVVAQAQPGERQVLAEKVQNESKI